MPRYVFTPIPIRLPLSAVAALAEAMALLDDQRLTRRARTIRLAVMFRLRPETLPQPNCPVLVISEAQS